MNFWCWMNANSGAIQSLAASAGAILTIVTIAVLIVTWKAIKEQADAARALQIAAVEQTRAAVDAARSSQLQSELLTSQLELSKAPLLVSEWRSGHQTVVVNRGHGVAFDVQYWVGTLELKDQSAISRPLISTLAPGAESELRFDGYPKSWTISFRGIDGQERWTTSHSGYEKPQEHYVRRGTEIVRLA